ncbi:MAG TPA: response regulator [Pyrinomonadaceae bacterium]|jgi:CheY-like chemotaxis protein|nr:response regulator [Pyrinomonadaceae bacterium]
MSQPDDARRTILVVEDVEDTRQLLALQLRGQGYHVVEACDGREALIAAERDHPDLILMDLSLPTLDGLSAIYRLRESETTARVPVIACTAHSPELHMKAARAVGCDEYVTKPVDLTKLTELVGRLLADGRGDAAAPHPAGARPRSDEELLDYIEGLMGDERR